MINAKKKGNAGENKFANWLQSKGIKAYKNSSSGGNEWKSDIHNSIEANFEVKTVKRINLQEAWRQTCRDSNMAHTTPYLAIHFDGMGENDWLMVMSNHDWLELIMKPKDEKIVGQEIGENREMKWALENLKLAINKVLKQL